MSRKRAIAAAIEINKLSRKKDYGIGYVSSAKNILAFPGVDIISTKQNGTIRKRGIPNRESFDLYQKIYFMDPVVKQNINLVCRMVVASGWRILSVDERAREKTERFFDGLDMANILYSWIKDSKIFGTGFLEFTGDNLVPRAPQTMEVQMEQNGEIIGFLQKPLYARGSTDYIQYEPKQIAMLKNDSFSDFPYGVSDIECIIYLVKLKDYGERDVGAMLNRYVGERFNVTVGTDTINATPDRIDEVAEFFKGLQTAEDIVHGKDISVEQMTSGNHAFDFRAYLDYILMAMGQGLGVPILAFWSGEGSSNAVIQKQSEIFASYVKFLQASVAHVINTQIIPNIVKTKHVVKIAFNNFDENEEFVKAKTDLIWLDQLVKKPDEVRRELGLPPLGADEEEKNGVLKNPNIIGDKTPADEQDGADDARAEREQDVRE